MFNIVLATDETFDQDIRQCIAIQPHIFASVSLGFGSFGSIEQAMAQNEIPRDLKFWWYSSSS
jgi:hypothetical protein